MRGAKLIGGLLAILLAAPSVRGEDPKPAETLAGLQEEYTRVGEELERGRKPGTTEAGKEEALADFYRKTGAIGRRALALADAHPEAPEALAALLWVVDLPSRPENDAAYDRLASRHLDTDAILPVVRVAWNHWVTSHAETFLRAAVERSNNLKVRSLACFSLGRSLQECADTARDLDDPSWTQVIEKNLNATTIQRLRGLKPEPLLVESEALYERTLREFADLRPMGDAWPTLGEQAEGALYRLRNLEVGRTVPEIEAEDLDGRPMKLSDSRGKVVLISFWATWCGPCMGMVPDEKALVERMKGRPFVLVGVDGDEDRGQAKAVAAKEGMTWRSFWDRGPNGPISLKLLQL